MTMGGRGRSILYAAAMTALLGLYVWLVGSRAVVLIQTGRPAGIGIGAAVLVIPVLTVWFVGAEWRQARAVSAMYAELAQRGELIVDDLPRSRGGRIDKEAALGAFPRFAAAAEADPEDWRAWFHLGWAYDAAGDRRRARTSLRRAAQLFRRRPA